MRRLLVCVFVNVTLVIPCFAINTYNNCMKRCQNRQQNAVLANPADVNATQFEQSAENAGVGNTCPDLCAQFQYSGDEVNTAEQNTDAPVREGVSKSNSKLGTDPIKVPGG